MLNPIDINLLGLRVRTNQVALLLEAVPERRPPGPAAVLGDLLCGGHERCCTPAPTRRWASSCRC